MTRVFNLSTQEELFYTLPPVESLVSAYMLSASVNNAFISDKEVRRPFMDMVKYGPSGKTAFLGNLSVIL